MKWWGHCSRLVTLCALCTLHALSNTLAISISHYREFRDTENYAVTDTSRVTQLIHRLYTFNVSILWSAVQYQSDTEVSTELSIPVRRPYPRQFPVVAVQHPFYANMHDTRQVHGVK